MNRLWRVDDPKQVALVRKVLSTRNIFIADGHHRYETAWNYSQEQGKKAAKRSPEVEYNYVLVFLCPMEDPGLVIWPTHRVLQTPADIEERISTYFNVLPAAAYAKLSKKLPQPLLVYIGGKSRTLVLKNKATLKQAMPDKCKAYQELAVSILHSVLLSGVAPDTITYVKSETEAFRLARERKHMAVLVPATPMAAIKAIALAGQTMPQKSTYFYPKLATGMVIHSLE
jgi:uncharacterized protein (DUF1015 family)